MRKVKEHERATTTNNSRHKEGMDMKPNPHFFSLATKWLQTLLGVVYLFFVIQQTSNAFSKPGNNDLSNHVVHGTLCSASLVLARLLGPANDPWFQTMYPSSEYLGVGHGDPQSAWTAPISNLSLFYSCYKSTPRSPPV